MSHGTTTFRARGLTSAFELGTSAGIADVVSVIQAGDRCGLRRDRASLAPKPEPVLASSWRSVFDRGMGKTYEATTSIDIDAATEVVWRWLTAPDLIAQYMHGTRTQTDWKVGSPIAWVGEWQGQEYRDKGEITVFEPGRRLAMTHWSPLTGDVDVPENYHHVAYELTQLDAGATRLTLTHGNSRSQEAADAMIENGWRPTLVSLKGLVEKS